MPLKIAITPSSLFGLSGDFSQLLSHGSGPRGSRVNEAVIREMPISFLFNIDFPVR